MSDFICGQEASGKCFFIFVSIIRYRKPGLSMLVELPKRIHAVTVDGLMKVIFFIFVFTINEIT